MGALLRGIKREQIRRGQVIAAPGSIKAVKKFQAQIYVSLLEAPGWSETGLTRQPGFDQG